MNHIHSLTTERDALRRELAALREGLSDLKAYLHSDKFCGFDCLDNYVNVDDIFLRLGEAEQFALYARENKPE